MQNDELLAIAVELAKVMNQFQVRYAVIGGIATSVRTQPRFTRDVDLLVNVPALVLPRLLEELERAASESSDTIALRLRTEAREMILPTGMAASFQVLVLRRD